MIDANFLPHESLGFIPYQKEGYEVAYVLAKKAYGLESDTIWPEEPTFFTLCTCSRHESIKSIPAYFFGCCLLVLMG